MQNAIALVAWELAHQASNAGVESVGWRHPLPVVPVVLNVTHAGAGSYSRR